MQFNANVVKVLIVSGLALGVAGSVFASGDKGSILSALKNSQDVKNVALNPGHSKHDKNGDGRDEHMDGRNGNGYGHNGGPGCVPPPSCVPEPASMLALGAGAGIMALKRRRAAKKA